MIQLAYYFPDMGQWAYRRAVGFMREACGMPDVEAVCVGLLSGDQRAFPGPVDGIAGSFDPGELEKVCEMGIPVVSLNDDVFSGVSHVVTDRDILAVRVLDFVTERGGRELAFFVDESERFLPVKPIFDALSAEAKRRGIEPIHIPRTGPRLRGQAWNLRDMLADLADQLKRLPPFTTVIGMDDWHANRVVMAAKQAGVAIPGRLSVIGIGNEPIYCESIHPTITSIMLEQEEKGARAARLLRDLVLGKARPGTTVKLPPRDIVARESTGFGQAGDRRLQKAFGLMKAGEGERPDLETLARQSGMSLRTLHRKVNEATGMTPAAVMHAMRLEKALALLRDTEHSLAEVADLAGYGLPSQLSREVKRHTGRTAARYRAQWR
jgi:LacI family transcriptional regulator